MLNCLLTIGNILMYLRNNNSSKTKPCGTSIDISVDYDLHNMIIVFNILTNIVQVIWHQAK